LEGERGARRARPPGSPAWARRARAWGRSRVADLPLEGVEVVGEPHERGVVGWWPTVEEAAHDGCGRAGPAGDHVDERCGVGPSGQPDERSDPVAGRRAQPGGREVAGPGAPV